ncbi:bifunctional 4-hydroxy-2-oxoglutarate aldolase/2-dehydro-3-deoxy-phosphogluconate aldolase [Leifsonia sp. 2MCAF36]|uniref:bifunctional 4-hydroxy-2-oxoglutarate aldolase/2-dehydro-3-deoxy-phosphogluconate aldolase n=1 Tax=Leifsonia sp. 2MCAF36 TaxID=3232988 RepID=UPI003F9C1BDF
MTGFDRILPVVVIDKAEDAQPLGRALLAGGVRQAEITLRTPEALDALRSMARIPGLLVGAGTVLDASQAEAVLDAGASFVVSPGLSEDVVAVCERHGVPVVPGVATATELMRARARGLRTVKFFPAEASGGTDALSALASVFPDMRFVPTGGIGAARARDYAALPSVVAVGGSWMVPRAAIAAGDFAAVEELCRTAMAAVG